MNATNPGAPKVTTFHTPITAWGVVCPVTRNAYGKSRRPPSAPARIAVGRITLAAGPPSLLGHTRSRASHRATQAMIHKEPYATNPIDMVQKSKYSRGT